MKKVKLLATDWDNLLMSGTYLLGDTKLVIKPLGIVDLSIILKKIESFFSVLRPFLDKLDADKEISKENIFEGKSLADIVEMVVPALSKVLGEDIKEILSLMSGLDEEDCGNLPLNFATELLQKCVEINIKSQEGLEKNLVSLGNSIMHLLDRADSEVEVPKDSAI